MKEYIGEDGSLIQQFASKKLWRVLLLGFVLLACGEVFGQPNEDNTISQDELIRLIYKGHIAKVIEVADGNAGIYLRQDYLTRPEHKTVTKKFFGLVDNDGPHYYLIVPHGSELKEIVTKLEGDNPYMERIPISTWGWANDFESPSKDTPNFLFIGFLIGIVLVYFIPSIISYQKQNAAAIIALNILLGWTFVGWVVALVWALTKERKDVGDNLVVHEIGEQKTTEPKSVVDELERLHQLKEKGVLTDTEFQQQKERLLNQ